MVEVRKLNIQSETSILKLLLSQAFLGPLEKRLEDEKTQASRK